MTQISARVRARIVALGEMSRPLDEDRAAAFGRELARSVVSQMRFLGDAEPAFRAYELRIRQEIAARSRLGRAAPTSSPSTIYLRDLLPEIPLANGAP